MREHVDTIERTCSPIQLVTGLGLDPSRSGEHYTITCPACHNRLFVLETGFLCAAYDCDFRAGGTLDFLKLQRGLKTYGEAIDAMETVFPGALRPHRLS